MEVKQEPANTLFDNIKQRQISLGSTKDGSDWCLKALHPACDILSTRGIPDCFGFPTVTMDYETVVSISPPPGTTEGANWTCFLYQLGHPIEPVSIKVTNSLGQVSYGGICNPTLAGVDVGVLSQNWLTLCNSWRMLYSSYTVDLDAAGLNNQGSVVSAQYPLATTTLNLCLTQTTSPYAQVITHVVSSDYVQNQPGLALGQLPGAYMGLAKDGIYMPLKIDPRKEWANSECPVLSVPNASSLPRGCGIPSAIPIVGTCFPFYGQPAYNATMSLTAPDGVIPAYCPTSFVSAGTLMQPQQQSMCGLSVFYNLSWNARLTVKVKWGVEMMVPAVSTLAPCMKPSAHLDTVALGAYSELNASLPFAYPSSYNSDNILLETIKRAWNALKPLVSGGLAMIPHPLAKAASLGLSVLPSFERPSGSSADNNKIVVTRNQNGAIVKKKKKS